MGLLKIYQRKKYNLPKVFKQKWFADSYIEKTKLPPYLDKDGEYIRYKIGDIVPMIELHNGKIAFYKIIKCVTGRMGDDRLPWDDGKDYDLEFERVGVIHNG